MLQKIEKVICAMCGGKNNYKREVFRPSFEYFTHFKTHEETLSSKLYDLTHGHHFCQIYIKIYTNFS